MSGFLFYSHTDGGASLTAFGDRMSVVAPNWFSINASTGAVYTGSSSPPQTPPTGYPQVVAAAAARGFELWPVLNLNFGSATGGTAPTGNAPNLDNARWRVNTVNSIMTVATHWQGVSSADFSGFTLDMEGLWASDRSRWGSPTYSQSASAIAFVQALAARLHAAGLKLAVYAPRRTTGDVAATSYTPRSYDWPALSHAADLLVVSGYNEHGPGPPPGPVTTSAGWQALLAYAASVSKDTIVPLAGAYGYDWLTGGGSAIPGPAGTRYQSPAALDALAAGHDVTPTSTDGEHTFTYTDASGQPHVVYYETAEGLASRVAAARSLGIGWWGMWSADRTPSPFWAMVP